MSKLIRIDSLHSGDRHKCIANGDGFRIVVWFLGCDIRCTGCHNTDFWDFNNPNFKDFSEEDIQMIISEMEQNISIYSGLSVLGGEPFSVRNIDDAITLCKTFKEKFSEKNIWIWSGHELQWLNSQKDEYGEKIKQLLDLCDVLVDGHFDVSRRNISLKFRGSENQIIWEKDENKNWFKSKLNEK